MATRVYDSKTIRLIDGTLVYLTPLKIKYLREFMDAFEFVKTAKNDEEAIFFLSECARIAMQQYHPSIQTIFDLEDMVDLKTIYEIIDVAAGVKVKKDSPDVKKDAVESGSEWEKLDLAKLESELFLLGIWRDYEELEISLSMPELMAALEVKREMDYDNKKFHAAIQGVDLDKESGRDKANAWEEMKARVFSVGHAKDSNDVVALQGANAQKAGFGIGMGLSYEKVE
jgi:hypothetical protein